MPSSLKHRVRRSAAAAAVGQIISQAISIGSLAILLRILAPTHYGLVGMVVPVVMFLRIFTTFGLNIATVQQRNLADDEASALFWFTLLGGLITAACGAASAPLVAWFYAQADLHRELMHLTWALSGTLFIVALGAQHQALLERRLQFGRLAALRVTAQAVGVFAAIAAALAGWGVWALIVQQYAELGTLVSLAWWAAQWQPQWPRFTKSLAGALRYGGWFTAATMVLFIADHLDRLLLGRLVGPESVGLYGQAKNLMLKPIYLVTTPLSAIAVSSLARAANRPVLRIQVAVALYRCLAIVLIPVTVGLVLVGRDTMLVLGGDSWRAAGPILTILALGLFAQAIIIINGWVLAAVGQTMRLLASALAVLGVLATAFTIGWIIGNAWHAETLGIVWGYATAMLVLLLIPHTWYTFRVAKLPIQPVVQSITRPLSASLAMGCIVWLVGSWLETVLPQQPVGQLAIEVATGIIVYGSLARNDIQWLKSQSWPS